MSKKLKIIYEIEVDNFTELKRFCKEEGYDEVKDFFDDYAKGLFEDGFTQEIYSGFGDLKFEVKELNMEIAQITKETN